MMMKRPVVRARFIRRAVAAAIAGAALLGQLAGTSRAAEPHVVAAMLAGDPEVGCIVITDTDACARNRISGDVVADGEASLAGRFAFHLTGFRASGTRLLERPGRGRVEATFTAPGAPARHCVLKGRVRAHGVSLPAGASARRFHTGTFDARGRCDGQRARLKAIWSGAIGSDETAGLTLDFERFQGKLAGTLLLK